MRLRTIYIFVIFSVFFLQACATRIPLKTIELPSKVTSDDLSSKKIAIMPPVGRILSVNNQSIFLNGYNGYIKHINDDDGVVSFEVVKEKMLEEKELYSDYKKLVNNINDFNNVFTTGKNKKSYKVKDTSWNDSEGIKYENILTVYKPKNKKVDASNLKIDWTIDFKEESEDQNLVLSSSKRLSESLSCDYLLIPELIDNYYYNKGLLTIFFVPFWYVYQLHHTPEIALYLIDGKSGQIVRASLGKQMTSTLSAAMLQRITEKGDFMGTLTLEEINKGSKQ